MTTFINARFLSQPLSGVQRFAGEILGALDRQLTANPELAAAIGPIKALHPAGVLRHPKWRLISAQQIGRTRGHVWEQGALLRASKTGILVSLGNAGPLRHPAQILTLHDANIWEIPDAFSPAYKLLHKSMRPMLARRAKRLLTGSKFSATALSGHLGIEVDRFSVIPNGANHILNVAADHSILQEYGLRKNEYLLSVGNLSPNKNIEKLIQAHSLAGASVPPLVVVGGAASGVEMQRLTASSRVRFLGRVSDGALRALYEQALGFVFPSLYEGFGIPPLEAMQLGAPVLASNTTAMPEVLQDGAMFFDPTGVYEMAVSLHQFSNLSNTERSTLIERGTKISAGFTWDKSALLLARQILSLKAIKSSGGQAVRTHNALQRRKAL
jgi:glycosyltransferase involved in cell wall biosynthesis